VSTDYPLYKDGTHELWVCEGSSEFTIGITEEDKNRHPDVPDGICILSFPDGRSLTAEEVVDIAVKLLQPTLYNVEDPQKFFKEVILKKVNELHV
jgi:hypothetical protein